jgi:peptidyl-dipeptidase A
MLGSLLASQLAHTISREAMHAGENGNVSFAGEIRVGDFLKEKVFDPGARYRWDEMIRRATGEPLTALYFAKDFVTE